VLKREKENNKGGVLTYIYFVNRRDVISCAKGSEWSKENFRLHITKGPEESILEKQKKQGFRRARGAPFPHRSQCQEEGRRKEGKLQGGGDR